MSSWKKTHTISVKTGTYTTHDGQTKNRYENIGRVMTDSDTGGKMHFLKRTFNPAGVSPTKEGDDEILLSIFEDRPRESQMSEADFPESPPPAPRTAAASVPVPTPQHVTVGANTGEQIPIF